MERGGFGLEQNGGWHDRRNRRNRTFYHYHLLLLYKALQYKTLLLLLQYKPLLFLLQYKALLLLLQHKALLLLLLQQVVVFC